MQIACSVRNERLGSERFTGSQAKKGRNGGQATCKDCQGDEGAAARAAQQQRELQSFLFAESDGALDGKKRSFKGVERRAAMPFRQRSKMPPRPNSSWGGRTARLWHSPAYIHMY